MRLTKNLFHKNILSIKHDSSYILVRQILVRKKLKHELRYNNTKKNEFRSGLTNNFKYRFDYYKVRRGMKFQFEFEQLYSKNLTNFVTINNTYETTIRLCSVNLIANCSNCNSLL